MNSAFRNAVIVSAFGLAALVNTGCTRQALVENNTAATSYTGKISAISGTRYGDYAVSLEDGRCFTVNYKNFRKKYADKNILGVTTQADVADFNAQYDVLLQTAQKNAKTITVTGHEVTFAGCLIMETLNVEGTPKQYESNK
jgi:hypothetical protein